MKEIEQILEEEKSQANYRELPKEINLKAR